MSRRDVLKYAAAPLRPRSVSARLQASGAGARRRPPPLGILLDYAAGVISAADIRASGALGRHPVRLGPPARRRLDAGQADPAARGPRPVPERAEDRVLLPVRQAGHRGLARRAERRRRARQAGLAVARRRRRVRTGRRSTRRSTTTPRYDQYKQQVAPYLRGWEAVLGHQRVGVYANSKTIDWALQDGLGSYFWQHNWGSPQGFAHPAAHLHQVEIDKRNVGGVGVDINHILQAAFRAVGLRLTDQ